MQKQIVIDILNSSETHLHQVEKIYPENLSKRKAYWEPEFVVKVREGSAPNLPTPSITQKTRPATMEEIRETLKFDIHYGMKITFRIPPYKAVRFKKETWINNHRAIPRLREKDVVVRYKGADKVLKAQARIGTGGVNIGGFTIV